jgi:3-isopropylmalate/(R)-2-methylmalate dehydratase small subunit
LSVTPFLRVEGVAAPLPIDNVDTDAIIPSRETQSVSRDGYGERLFAYWRYEAGTRIIKPDFILNREPFNKAKIIVGGSNYGCGSSREAAVWSHIQFGIRCVIAPSFGAIFYNNCIRNGLLPVVLPPETTAAIVEAVLNSPGTALVSVDLAALEVAVAGGGRYRFVIKPREREMLMTGADEVALTLMRRTDIEAFRAKDRILRPWIYARSQR